MSRNGRIADTLSDRADAREDGVAEPDGSVPNGVSDYRESNPAGLLLGTSPPMRALAVQIQRAATTDLPMIITGERGSGKEFVARIVHNLSSGGNAPFVVVDCATLHATSGAGNVLGVAQEPAGGEVGPAESAKGGVLFLGKIENLPNAMHAPVLDLLGQRAGMRQRQHDGTLPGVRIIATTRLSLPALRRTGKLGEQLGRFPRVLHLHVPALRERKGDVSLLATRFMRQVARETGRRADSLSSEALALLEAYSWPGNVRELFATVQRAVVLCDSGQIEAADFGLQVAVPARIVRESRARPAPGTQAEREMLVQALRTTGFNITRTAQGLSVSRVTLYRMLRRNHLVLRHDCVGWEELGGERRLAGETHPQAADMPRFTVPAGDRP